MKNAKGKIDIFEMEKSEFDSWLESASVSEMADAGVEVLTRLESGYVLHPEEKRRFNLFYARIKAACWPTLALRWLLATFPYILVWMFQAYLVIGKLFRFGPFCQMSWLETFLPLAVLAVFRLFTVSKGK